MGCHLVIGVVRELIDEADYIVFEEEDSTVWLSMISISLLWFWSSGDRGPL